MRDLLYTLEHMIQEVWSYEWIVSWRPATGLIVFETWDGRWQHSSRTGVRMDLINAKFYGVHG